MDHNEYEHSQERHDEIINAMKPLCELYNIKYEHTFNEADNPIIILDGQTIYVGGDSTLAIELEVLGYIFIKHWCKYRTLGAFSTQSKNVIKRYWKK